MPINYDIKQDAFYKEGIKKGRERVRLEITLRMKKAGFSMADVVKATGLTKAQIEQL